MKKFLLILFLLPVFAFAQSPATVSFTKGSTQTNNKDTLSFTYPGNVGGAKTLAPMEFIRFIFKLKGDTVGNNGYATNGHLKATAAKKADSIRLYNSVLPLFLLSADAASTYQPIGAYEVSTNKTATPSASATLFPNWLGLENYAYPLTGNPSSFELQSNKKTTLDNSTSHYPTGSAVTDALNNYTPLSDTSLFQRKHTTLFQYGITDGITNNSNQSGLSGDKVTSGIWEFNNLLVNATNLGGVSLSPYYSTGGGAGKLIVGENRSASMTETDFISVQGYAPFAIGGFHFSKVDTLGTETGLLDINGLTGAITTFGKFVVGDISPSTFAATKYVTLDASTGAFVSRTTAEVLSDIGGGGGGSTPIGGNGITMVDDTVNYGGTISTMPATIFITNGWYWAVDEFNAVSSGHPLTNTTNTAANVNNDGFNAGFSEYNLDQSIQYTQTGISAQSSGVSILNTGKNGTQSLTFTLDTGLNATNIILQDTLHHGIILAGNWHSSFLPHSLVDKAYVDSVATGGSGGGTIAGSGLTMIAPDTLTFGGVLTIPAELDLNHINYFQVFSFGTPSPDHPLTNQTNFSTIFDPGTGFASVWSEYNSDESIQYAEAGLFAQSSGVQIVNSGKNGEQSLTFLIDTGLNVTNMVLQDTLHHGIVLGGNYHSSFLPFSYVDKSYADSLAIKNITIFAPTSGGTVTITNGIKNIINPAGTLSTLTIAMPSSPNDKDNVFIKFTQDITAVTYTGGTVIAGLISPVAGNFQILTWDASNSSWF